MHKGGQHWRNSQRRKEIDRINKNKAQRAGAIVEWRENKKPRCGDGFDNVLNEELEVNEDHENRTVQRQFPKL